MTTRLRFKKAPAPPPPGGCDVCRVEGASTVWTSGAGAEVGRSCLEHRVAVGIAVRQTLPVGARVQRTG